MKYFKITPFILLLSLFLMVACEKEKVVVQGGNFTFQESKYPIKRVKVSHVDYRGDDYLLRLLAYPVTYTVTETSTSGYGTVIDAAFISPTKDFEVGGTYSLDADSSWLVVYPEIKKGETAPADTLYYMFEDGHLKVDTADGYRTFNFALITTDGDSVVGSYIGDYIYNYTLDQRPYGELHFDTTACQLAMPVMWQWGHLFSENYNYFELVFYSVDSRFNDAGKIKSGVQFVVGIHDIDSDRPKANKYSVSEKADGVSVYYGHKLKNTAWGTYWQSFYNSSPIGKANIVDGTASILSIDDTSLHITFRFTDQLGDEVIGSYNGPYGIGKK